MNTQVEAIGFVQAIRPHAQDDFWGGEEACISLADGFTAEALQGLCEFSHIELLFLFHQVDLATIVSAARHPRNNSAWPAVGIFAQRGKNRPNRIGSTICRLVRVEGTKLLVAELDAINGTPVLDIKPVMAEFLPRQQVRQPTWSHELMKEYWSCKTPQIQVQAGPASSLDTLATSCAAPQLDIASTMSQTMKIVRSKEFKASRAWGALDIANMNGTTTRLNWTDQPYKWHVNDGEEVFAVLDGTVDMHYRESGLEQVVTLEGGDIFFAGLGCEHVAHPRGEARILVVERDGSV